MTGDIIFSGGQFNAVNDTQKQVWQKALRKAQ